MASCTTRGEGLTPPLFKLISERSTVKACWISRQNSSSAAILSGEESPADLEAASMRSMPPSRSEARVAMVVAVPMDLKKVRRVNINHLRLQQPFELINC